MLKLILIVASATIFVLLLVSIFFFRHKLSKTNHRNDIENPSPDNNQKKQDTAAATVEELTTFEGGEDLTIDEILEAPGEVIGKYHYGTLYKASLQSTQRTTLLMFLRPAAVESSVDDVVRFLGSIRHRNLVPMLGFYAGGRGERLLVHPFYGRGNLSEFITGKFDFDFLFVSRECEKGKESEGKLSEYRGNVGNPFRFRLLLVFHGRIREDDDSGSAGGHVFYLSFLPYIYF